MSNFAAIAVILVLVILVFFAALGGAKWLHNLAEIVILGQSGGIPVSTRHRRLMLHANWFSWVGYVVALQVIAALAFIGLAENVGDPNVATFAYICAWFAGIAAVAFAVFGGAWLIHMLSVLRQAEAD